MIPKESKAFNDAIRHYENDEWLKLDFVLICESMGPRTKGRWLWVNEKRTFFSFTSIPVDRWTPILSWCNGVLKPINDRALYQEIEAGYSIVLYAEHRKSQRLVGLDHIKPQRLYPSST